MHYITVRAGRMFDVRVIGSYCSCQSRWWITFALQLWTVRTEAVSAVGSYRFPFLITVHNTLRKNNSVDWD